MTTLVLAPGAAFQHYALASSSLADWAPPVAIGAAVLAWAVTFWWTHVRKSRKDG